MIDLYKRMFRLYKAKLITEEKKEYTIFDITLYNGNRGRFKIWRDSYNHENHKLLNMSADNAFELYAYKELYRELKKYQAKEYFNLLPKHIQKLIKTHLKFY